MIRHPLTKQQRYYRKNRKKILAAAKVKYEETREEYLARMRSRTPEQRPKTDKEYMRKYYRKNKVKAQKQSKAYYQANRDVVIDRAKKAYARDPEARWAYMIEYKFGVTAEQYYQMLEEQGGVCAICKQPPSGRFKKLAVDHCHKTGKVRGLLHSGCNTALGRFGDDPEVLRNAVAYLESSRKST